MAAPTFTARDRRALQSVATQFFINGVVFASISPRLPEIRTRIDVTTGTLGVLLAIGGVAGLLGSLSVGRLIERFGSRRVLIGSGLALTAALPTIGYATTPAMLLVGLMMYSAFDVIVDSAMNLQGSWLSARRSEPVMNRLHGLWSLATVLGGLLAAQLAASEVSIQTHLVSVSVVLVVVLVFVGRGLLVEDEHEQTVTTTGEDGDVRPVARAAARRALVLMALIAGCSIVIEMTSSDWAAFRLADDLGAAPGVAALGFVGFTAGMTIGRLGGDWMQVRLGRTRLFQLGVLLAAAGLAAATMIDVVPVVVGGYVLTGLGVATQFPKLYDDAAKLPGRPGAGLGALTGGSRVAMLFAPMIVGGLAGTSLTVGAAVAIVTFTALTLFVVLERMISRVG